MAWGDLLNKQTPFDRMPYEELGKTLRGQGRERDSRLVYQRMQERRLREHWAGGERLAWLRLTLFWVLGYGVRPWWLLGLAALLVGAFSLVFDNPGAVVATEKGVAARTLTWMEALAYCVRLFVPVEVPLGGAWKASETVWFWLGRQPVVYTVPATVLKLAGSIVTPFGIAAVAGLFSRLKRG